MNDSSIPPEFCAAPWKVLHVSPQGDVFSCYESGAVLGNLHESSLAEIWRSSTFVALRQKMLAGERVAACEKCHIKSDAIAGQSLRTLVNQQTGGDSSVRELFVAGELEPVLAPQILDLSFSNVCNLKCRMCSSIYSKAWIDDEVAAFGRARGVVRELSDAQLRSEIFPLLGGVRKLTLAGGEPLLDRRNRVLLEHLISIGRQDIAIEYNTNATMIDDATLELWRQFPKLRVAFSLDASGARFEYLRKGAKWSRAVDVVNKIRARVPSASLECYSTVSVFNAFTHSDFMTEVLSTRLFSPQEMSLHYVVEPRHLSVQTLPAAMKVQIQEKLFTFIRDGLLARHDLADSQRLILQIKMLVNYMSARQTSDLAEFIGATTKLDTIRGENFRTVFPELSDYLRHDA